MTCLHWPANMNRPCQWAKIEVADGKLVGNIASQPITLTPVGPRAPLAGLTFLADGRVLDRARPVEFERA